MAKMKRLISSLLLLLSLSAVSAWAGTAEQEIERAHQLTQRADALFQQGKYQEALPLFQRSLAIREKALGAEHADIAVTLINMSILYDKLGQYDLALPLAQRALAIREKALGSEHADTAESLINLVGLYMAPALRQYDRALPLAQRALAIRERTLGSEHADTVDNCLILAGLYFALRQYDQALPLAQRLLVIREKTLGPEHPRTADSRTTVAGLYYALGRYDQALLQLQRALVITEKAFGPEHADTATSLNYLAALYQELGQYGQALSLYQRALAIREKALGPEHADTAFSLDALAMLYEKLGQYDRALPLYQRALAIGEKIHGPEHADTATSLGDLARQYKTLGQYDQALQLYQRSLAIREKILGPEHSDTATSLHDLGAIYAILGQYDTSLQLYQRALAIFEKTRGPEHANTAASLLNLAVLYKTLGQYDRALPLYQRSLAIIEKTFGPEHAETANSLSHLAELYRILGQYDHALPLRQRSLAIREKVLGPEHVDTAYSLTGLADLYRIFGQYDQALPLYQRALAIREKAFGREHFLTATSLNNLATLYQTLGQYDRALPLYQQALRAASVAGVPDTLRTVQGGMAGFYAKQGQANAGIFFYKQAVNTMQRIRAQSRGLDKGLQKSLVGKNEELYKQLSALLIDTGRLAEAQQVMAMLKEEEYFDYIQRDSHEQGLDQRASLSGAEEPWAERYGQISGKLAGIGRELAELRKKQETQTLSKEELDRLSTLENDLEVANVAFDKMLGALVAGLKDSQTKQTVSDKVDDIGARQGTLEELGAGTVLLQYLILDDRVSILLSTPTVRLAREGNVTQAQLNRMIAAYRETLRNPKLDPQPQAQALHKLLIAPVAADLEQAQAKVIMLSLDGALRYLPFAALYDGQHYLMERYALSLYNEAAADKLKDKNAPNWKVWGLGVTQAHPGFAALSSVKGELDGIIGQAGLSGQALLDQAFDEPALKDGVTRKYPVLHIASHFKFTPGTLSDSYLLLGNGVHLTLQDVKVKYSFVGVDLVTLSACETGFGGGQDATGREVEGLGAIMQKRGAKSVMATLWPVEDSSTAQLMKGFYSTRQQQHMNKAEALRQAQLALLKGGKAQTVTPTSSINPDERGARRVSGEQGAVGGILPFQANSDAPFAHPYFWAPFILMGNWL